MKASAAYILLIAKVLLDSLHLWKGSSVHRIHFHLPVPIPTQRAASVPGPELHEKCGRHVIISVTHFAEQKSSDKEGILGV